MLHLLTALFACFKVFGLIDWSWWLVLAPSYIPISIIIGVLMLPVFKR